MIRYSMMEFAIPTMNRKDPLTAAPTLVLLLRILSSRNKRRDRPIIPPTLPIPPKFSKTSVLMAIAQF